MCEVELLPGGWLVRLADEDAAPAISRVTLDLRRPGGPALEMVGQFGSWRHGITLRHAEILLATGLSRLRWLAGHLVVGALGCLAVLGSAGVGLGAGYDGSQSALAIGYPAGSTASVTSWRMPTGYFAISPPA